MNYKKKIIAMTWMDRFNDMLRPLTGLNGLGTGRSALDNALLDARQALGAEEFDSALTHADRAAALKGYVEQAADAQFERARALIGLGRFDVARTVLEKLQRDAPGTRGRAQALIGLGELAAAEGDSATQRASYEAANRLLNEVTTSKATTGDVGALVRGRLSEISIADGSPKFSERLLKEALALLPDGLPGLRAWLIGLSGLAALEYGQNQEGVALLEQAIALSGAAGYRADVRRWSLRLGSHALMDGRADDAQVAYTRALSLFRTDGAAGKTDAYIDALLGMSRALFEGGKHDEGLITAQSALETAQGRNDGQRVAQAQGILGETLRALGRQAEAIPLLQAATADAANAPVPALRALAAAQYEAADVDNALLTYDRALRRADATLNILEGANTRRDLGLMLVHQGDPNAAIPLWTAAIPKYTELHATAQVARLYIDLANARRTLNQRGRSIKDIEEALMLINSLHRDDYDTRGLVLANAALIYADGADAESADAFFKESIELADSAKDPAAKATRLGNYGWFLLLIGRPRRAQTMLDQAITMSREQGLKLQEAVQIDNLGLVHDGLGEYPRALELHKEASALMNEVRDPYWGLTFRVNTANTLTALGRQAEALGMAEGVIQRAAREVKFQDVLCAAQIARARALVMAGDFEAAAAVIEEALVLARKLELRRLVAETLGERSRIAARRGDLALAESAWADAQKQYLILHMPQGKITPEWLAAKG